MRPQKKHGVSVDRATLFNPCGVILQDHSHVYNTVSTQI